MLSTALFPLHPAKENRRSSKAAGKTGEPYPDFLRSHGLFDLHRVNAAECSDDRHFRIAVPSVMTDEIIAGILVCYNGMSGFLSGAGIIGRIRQAAEKLHRITVVKDSADCAFGEKAPVSVRVIDVRDAFETQILLGDGMDMIGGGSVLGTNI